ncbi:MAG: peptide chain release factor N(5)-glutamine methyltransferase [Firmicutes bacterium]|nr:peptide chain release factor N(5)-glutamine methyltransferase [Bacillota bacterium]
MKISDFKNQVGDSNLAIEILSYILDKTKGEIFLVQELQPKIAKQGIEIAKQVKAGIPLAYALGCIEFFGKIFMVNEHVLVPRVDTEILVTSTLWLIGKLPNARVLDLCTGSGCIAVSIALNTTATVHASDISPGALEIAKQNAKKHNANITFVQSNMLENITEKYDIIVSNPPYIRTGEIGCDDASILHEPIIALDGGTDGLDFYRIIAQQVHGHLKPNGWLALEIGYDQAGDVVKLLEQNNWNDVQIKKDITGHNRVILATRRGKSK